MPSSCPMCQAPDCHQLRAQELDPCPVYFAVRDALVGGEDVPAKAASALFWLAQRLGREPLLKRQGDLAELLELFRFARLVGLEGLQRAVFAPDSDPEDWAAWRVAEHRAAGREARLRVETTTETVRVLGVEHRPANSEEPWTFEPVGAKP